MEIAGSIPAGVIAFFFTLDTGTKPMWRIPLAITTILDTLSSIVAITAALVYVVPYVAVHWRWPRV